MTFQTIYVFTTIEKKFRPGTFPVIIFVFLSRRRLSAFLSRQTLDYATLLSTKPLHKYIENKVMLSLGKQSIAEGSPYKFLPTIFNASKGFLL